MQKHIKHNTPWTEVYDHAPFSTPSCLAHELLVGHKFLWWVAHRSSLSAAHIPPMVRVRRHAGACVGLPWAVVATGNSQTVCALESPGALLWPGCTPMADGHLLLHYFRRGGTERVSLFDWLVRPLPRRSGYLGERLRRVHISASMVPQTERLCRRAGLQLSSHGLHCRAIFGPCPYYRS